MQMGEGCQRACWRRAAGRNCPCHRTQSQCPSKTPSCTVFAVHPCTCPICCPKRQIVCSGLHSMLEKSRERSCQWHGTHCQTWQGPEQLLTAASVLFLYFNTDGCRFSTACWRRSYGRSCPWQRAQCQIWQAPFKGIFRNKTACLPKPAAAAACLA